jgi:hypothetical protein
MHPYEVANQDIRTTFINANVPIINPIVQKHWLLEENVLRMYFTGLDTLYYFEGRKPTDIEIAKFKELQQYIIKEVLSNEAIRITHQ